jgi:hypothetical protein
LANQQLRPMSGTEEERILRDADAGDAYEGIVPEASSFGEVLLVAAFDATDEQRASAAYVCDGDDDQVQINEALDALPGEGGVVRLVGRNFHTTAPHHHCARAIADWRPQGQVR